MANINGKGRFIIKKRTAPILPKKPTPNLKSQITDIKEQNETASSDNKSCTPDLLSPKECIKIKSVSNHQEFTEETPETCISELPEQNHIIIKESNKDVNLSIFHKTENCKNGNEPSDQPDYDSQSISEPTNRRSSQVSEKQSPTKKELVSSDVICNSSEITKESNQGSKDQPTKSLSSKYSRRRFGPKLVSKSNVSNSPKIANDENDSCINNPLTENSTAINTKQQACLEETKVSSNCDSTNDSDVLKTCNDVISKEISENRAFECLSSSVDVVDVAKQQEPEGVVRVYLNCWPQYPLDDLKDDPFFENRNIKELGKVSVFMSNDHRIAYCDMASPVDFPNIPKNWAFVNFNKLIKEEFKEPEIEDEEKAVENRSFEGTDSVTDISNYNSYFDQPVYGRVNHLNQPYQNNNHEETADSYPEDNFCQTDLPLDLSIKKIDNDQTCNNNLEILSKIVTEEIESDNNTVICDVRNNTKCKKPYGLRKSKPSVKYREEIDKDDILEDIFSNSDDSDISEYDGELELKKKNIKTSKTIVVSPGSQKKKQRKAKIVKRTEGERLNNNVSKVKKVPIKRVRKKKEEIAVNEENDVQVTESLEGEDKIVKKEKPPKSMENASPFFKMGMEVKNKNKWDKDGNCAEPEKLELKDFIFYVPKNEPMVQEKKETDLNTDEVETIDDELMKEEEEEGEEETHGPKLIVKDGKIIVDPNSTKIKQTPLMPIRTEKWEKPKETNDPWELRETMKFYATLWKYGIDFSMLAGSFPEKKRYALKKKYSYEEKYNGTLLNRTLTKQLDLKSVLREVILIDALIKYHNKKKKKSENPDKESEEKEKKQFKHCLVQKPKRKRKNSNKSTDSIDKRVRTNSVTSVEDNDSCLSGPKPWLTDEIIISDDVNSINLKDIITFSTNVIYKDMNIVESVSFHPSAIQPVDINVTICHETDPAEDTAIK